MQPEELLGNNQENSRKESPLKSLETDLVLFSDSIKEIAEDIIDQHEAKIGELIIDKDELSTDWNIHASTLEEFVEKGIINSEKQEFFKQNYKDPSKFICVFVMVPEGANFVFYPYK
jgi:hypothetical protein